MDVCLSLYPLVALHVFEHNTFLGVFINGLFFSSSSYFDILTIYSGHTMKNVQALPVTSSICNG